MAVGYERHHETCSLFTVKRRVKERVWSRSLLTDASEWALNGKAVVCINEIGPLKNAIEECR